MDAKTIRLRARLNLKEQQDSDKPARLEGTAYSGGLIPDYNAVIDLETTTVRTPMPVFSLHRDDQYIGMVNEAIVSNELIVRGELFSDIDDEAKKIAAKARRGSPFELSVGLSQFNELWVEPGNTVEVNGRTFNGPLSVLQNGVVREVSVVPLGADPETSATIFSRRHSDGKQQQQQGEEMADKTEIEQLRAQLKAAQDEIEQLKAKAQAEAEKAAQFQRKARETEVRALFSEVGQEFSEEAAAPYMELSAEAFSALAEQLKSMKKDAGKPSGEAVFSAPNYGADGDDNNNDPLPGKSVLLANMKSRFTTA